MSIAVVAAMLSFDFANGQIKPGSTWNDTSGSFINAHGGQVVWHDGYYYWFGETRSTSVSCYRSTDLQKWTRLSDALKPTGTKTDDNKDIASGRNLERPKVAYCANTGKWVMYVHWENGSDYGQAKVAVAQADKVEGPYSLVDVFRPNDRDSRDQTIFVDTDGKAYHFCATGMNTDINVAQLTDDYLRPNGIEAQVLNGDRYEAPAIFKVGDTYFGLFSGCTGWDPNAGRRAFTQDIFGKWQHRKDPMQNYSYGENFCVDDDAYLSYHSQSTCVFPVHGKENCFVYMGDRWNSSKVASSKYVWLPLSVRSGYPTVRYYDSWDLSVFDDYNRFKRLKMGEERFFEDGTEVMILEKRSNRFVSRPKATFLIDDDGNSNVTFILRATDDPYLYRLQEKTSGNYLESVYGSMRLMAEKESATQLWYLELEEDGYFHITNENDKKVFSLSGNSTLAGSGIFLNEKNDDIAQSFAFYYDTESHPDYEEADIFSKAYRERNRVLMDKQSEAVGIQEMESDGQFGESAVYYSLVGQRVDVPVRNNVYVVRSVVDGRMKVRKVLFK